MSKKPTYEELEQRVRELESLESERKQIAESMRSLNEHLSFYRNAVGSMEDYKIAVVGPDYRYRIVSPQYLKIYNLTGAQIVGRTVAEIMGDDVFEHAIKPNLDRAMKGRAVHYSDWIELSDKGKRYLEVSYYPVVDEDQEVVSVIAMSHDITEKRSVDEALCDSEERTRSILQVIPDIIIQTNVQGEYLDIRTSSEDLLLLSKRELMGKRISDLFPEKVATRIIECIKTAIDTNRLQSVEYELELPTGKFSFEARIVSSGEDKALALIRDITERKQAEEALRESEQKYRNLVENANEAIFVAQEQKLVFVNPITSLMTGYSAEELQSQPFIEFIHPDDREMVLDRHVRRLKGEKLSHLYSFRVLHKDGSIMWGELNAVLINWDGKPATLNFMADITKRKQAEEATREREGFIKTVMDHLPIGVAVNSVDPTVEFSYMNDNFPKIYRTTREALAEPDTFWDVIYEDPVFREEIKNRVTTDVASGDPDRMNWEDIPFTRKGEGPFYICARNIPLEGKQVMISTVWDVTDRKLAEEALRDSRDLLDATQRLAKVGGWLWDVANQTMTWTGQTYRIHGFEPGEVVPGSPEHVERSLVCYNPDDRPVIEAAFLRCVEDGVPYGLEFPFTSVDGQRKWIQTTAQPVFDGQRVVKVIGNIVDITERKQAEEALRESEERHRTILSTAMDGFLVVDSAGRLIEVNETYCKMSGYTEQELLGLTINSLEAVETSAETAAHLQKVMLQGEDRFESRHCRKDGTVFDVEVSVQYRPTYGPQLVVFSRDITDRIRAEEEIEREARLRNVLLDNVPNCIALILKKETREIVASNKAAVAMGAVPGKTCFGTCAEREDECPFCLAPELWANNQLQELEVEYNGKWYEGVWAPFDDELYIHYIFDITEGKLAEVEKAKLESQLQQAQKMKAIGTLAGGIAHDFNNILSIIVGNTEIAMLDVPEWSPAQDNLKEVREATLRARELVKQILLFARQKEHTVSNISLEPIAKESIKMLRSSIPTTVKINTKIKKGLPPVLADPTQIQQIIMNLCTNAGQVMEDDGGTLTFTLDSVELDTRFVTVVGVLPPGRYVCMKVSDTGPGIPSEIVERVFDPFFTTKEVGKGTGLGLPVVHGIVQDRKGGITVESEEGLGTTFTVYFPVSEGESVEVKAEQKMELPRGTERVLFVDDEPMIMKMGKHMLERLGYIVETRASGTDALECFRQDPHRFDLVVTDMTMPGMRGDRLAEEMLAIREDIPIILCTGYSRQISKEKAGEIGIRAFVMKPLTQHELANTVRRVLDEKSRK